MFFKRKVARRLAQSFAENSSIFVRMGDDISKYEKYYVAIVYV